MARCPLPEVGSTRPPISVMGVGEEVLAEPGSKRHHHSPVGASPLSRDAGTPLASPSHLCRPLGAGSAGPSLDQLRT